MFRHTPDIPLYRPFRVLMWATLGPLACTLIALGYTVATFSRLGGAAYDQALANAVLLPLAMGIPLFLFVALKLNALSRANDRLGQLAATDGLTDCLNRTAFVERVEAGLNHTIRDRQRHGAFMVLDADNFKDVNDRFGHHVGDEALVCIAQTIRANVRRGDIVGRLGGEEFGIFLPGVDERIARQVAERIRSAVDTMGFKAGQIPCPLTISIGGIMCDDRARFEDLFARADSHLYAAKHAGRNRVIFAPDLLNGNALTAG